MTTTEVTSVGHADVTEADSNVTSGLPTVPDVTTELMCNITGELDAGATEATTCIVGNLTTSLPFWEDSDLLMHPYWERYRKDIEDIPDAVHYALGIYIGLVGIVGAVGNILVIYIFSSTARLRTPPNMLIINQAVSDLGFSIIIGFPLMTISSIKKKWIFGKLACELYGFIAGVFGMCSVNSLACISLDRHLVITDPFYARTHVTHRRAALQILSIWFLSFLWTTPPLLDVGVGRYVPEGFQTSCSFDYLSRNTGNVVFNYWLFVGGFCLPVAVIIYCYVHIVYVVSTQNKKMSKAANKMGAKDKTAEKKEAQELKLTKIAAGTVVLFVVSWLPYAIVAQLGILGYHDYITPYTCQIPVMWAKASATWNPILYALSHPKFRAALHEKIPWLVLFKEHRMDRDSSSDDGMSRSSVRKPVTDRRDQAEGREDVETQGQPISGQNKPRSMTSINTQEIQMEMGGLSDSPIGSSPDV